MQTLNSTSPDEDLVERIEDVLTQQDPDPYVICELIELLNGGSATKSDFSGKMSKLRAAKEDEYLLKLAELLDAEIQKIQHGKGDQSGLPFFVNSAADARVAYWEIGKAKKTVDRLPKNPVDLAPANNTFTQAGGLHHRVRKLMQG